MIFIYYALICWKEGGFTSDIPNLSGQHGKVNLSGSSIKRFYRSRHVSLVSQPMAVEKSTVKANKICGRVGVFLSHSKKVHTPPEILTQRTQESIGYIGMKFSACL